MSDDSKYEPDSALPLLRILARINYGVRLITTIAETLGVCVCVRARECACFELLQLGRLGYGTWRHSFWIPVQGGEEKARLQGVREWGWCGGSLRQNTTAGAACL